MPNSVLVTVSILQLVLCFALLPFVLRHARPQSMYRFEKIEQSARAPGLSIARVTTILPVFVRQFRNSSPRV